MYIHFSVSGFFPYTYVFNLTWKTNWDLKKFFKFVNFFLCVSVSTSMSVGMSAKCNGNGTFWCKEYITFLKTYNCFLNLGLAVTFDCEHFIANRGKKGVTTTAFCGGTEINYIIIYIYLYGILVCNVYILVSRAKIFIII